MRPRSTREGRRISQQKRPLNKALLPPAERWQGGHCHSSLPHHHDFPTQRLSVCPAIPPSTGAPCWFPLEVSPSSRGDLGNSRAHGRLRSQTSHHRQGLACPVEVNITHWRFVSKSPQQSHRDGSPGSVSNLLWPPFWAPGSPSILVCLL